MMPFLLLLSVLLLILVACSAFFSASETALFSLSRARLLSFRDAVSGPKRAITELMGTYHYTLIVLILGNMFVNVCISMVEDEIIQSVAGNTILADLLSIFLAVFLLLIFGEVTPKAIALTHTDKLALKVARPVWLLRRLLQPFAVAVNLCCAFVLDLLGRRKYEPLSHEEYSAFLETAYSGGILSQQEKKLLDSALMMSKKRVVDVMTGRVDTRMINRHDSAVDIAAFIRRERQNFFPVIDKDIDDADYMLSTKRFFMLPSEARENWQDSAAIIRALFIPETAGVHQALTQMNQAKVAVALVADEYGRVSGMVTKEDIFAEMVGDIDDEYDLPDYSYTLVDEGTWVFTGMIPLYLFEEVTGWKLPDHLDATTLNGLFGELLGRLPRPGDKVNIDNLVFRAESISKRRATRIRAWQIIPPTDEEAGS